MNAKAMTTHETPHRSTEAGRQATARAIDRMVRVGALAHGHCGLHYAHGLVERWCDRAAHHDGPCSGQLVKGR